MTHPDRLEKIKQCDINTAADTKYRPVLAYAQYNAMWYNAM